MAVEIGVAFGEGAHDGQIVFLELVGRVAELPAEDHHVGGGEGEREFLRRCLRTATIVVAGVRVAAREKGLKLKSSKRNKYGVSKSSFDSGDKYRRL